MTKFCKFESIIEKSDIWVIFNKHINKSMMTIIIHKDGETYG